ncbi:MAG: DUF4254 domain-containing protein [Nitrospinae bacterium]|nr:DUF4254 domain-containing protein [Nitrospinota bacterium]
MNPIHSKEILELQDAIIEEWHQKEYMIKEWDNAIKMIKSNYEGLLKIVFEIQLINCFQWHEEDKSRDTNLPDRLLVNIKRSIDRSNQRRNDKTEEIDAYILDAIRSCNINLTNEVPINSETPGSIIDRLSIISLKIYHMKQETLRTDVSHEHIMRCKENYNIIITQREDLSIFLDKLSEDLFSGKKRLKVYHHFKIYNNKKSN